MYRFIVTLIALMPFAIGVGLNLLSMVLNYRDENKRHYFFYFAYTNAYYLVAVLTFYFHGLVPALGMIGMNRALPGLNLQRN